MAAISETTDSSLDIWRKMPPEEKLDLMAKAQSKGLAATLVILVITGTVAAGLRIPWLFWGAFAILPFVFQFASAKAWRDIKPRAMLEYLAARSAARRYAYGAQAKDLAIELIFRGTLTPDYNEEEIQEALDAKLDERFSRDVWVGLFKDTLVMISERRGGAQLQFAHNILERLVVSSEGFEKDSSTPRRVVFDVYDKRLGISSRWFLTSPFPAALYVCERKILAAQAAHQAQLEKEQRLMQAMARDVSVGGRGRDDD